MVKMVKKKKKFKRQLSKELTPEHLNIWDVVWQEIKYLGCGLRLVRVQIPAHPLKSWGPGLSYLPSSLPQFPHVWSGGDNKDLSQDCSEV